MLEHWSKQPQGPAHLPASLCRHSFFGSGQGVWGVTGGDGCPAVLDAAAPQAWGDAAPHRLCIWPHWGLLPYAWAQQG